MTPRAVLRRIYVHKAQGLAGRPGPSHVSDLFYWSKIRFGIAMAIQAPAHTEGLVLAHHIHLIDAAMAGHATDAHRHVNAVIEVDVIGKIVNPFPFDWLTRRLTFPNAK